MIHRVKRSKVETVEIVEDDGGTTSFASLKHNSGKVFVCLLDLEFSGPVIRTNCFSLGIVASFQYYISTTCGAVFSFSSKG
jgi:hypothetical protein